MSIVFTSKAGNSAKCQFCLNSYSRFYLGWLFSARLVRLQLPQHNLRMELRYSILSGLIEYHYVKIEVIPLYQL